jgi:uncharacterized protein (DUF779 family)
MFICKKRFFNWKRGILYICMVVSLRGGRVRVSEREREFLVTKKDNNYSNVNAN